MLELRFAIEGAEPIEFAAAPQLALKLRVTSAEGGVRVEAALLRCQVHIDAPARRYAPGEAARLVDLFGEPGRWGTTLRPILWTQVTLGVPPFTGSTLVELPLPCSVDMALAPGKYLHGVQDGDIPVSVLFSGTVFHARADGAVQAAPIAWSSQARYGLPVRVWRAAVERHHADQALLALRRDVVDRLHRYRSEVGLPTLEQALERLLGAGGGGA